MGNHIIDSVLKVATCNRCSNIVFAADVAGLKVMADPTPITGLAEAGIALVDGKSLYRILYVAGKPHKLQLITRDPGQWLGAMVSEHGCGCSGRDAEPVVMAQEAHRGACAAWTGQGWTPPASCPRRGADGRTGLLFGDTVAPESCGSCEAPPFDHGGPRKRRAEHINRVCQRCNVLIGFNRDVIGVQIGDRWIWVQHDQC